MSIAFKHLHNKFIARWTSLYIWSFYIWSQWWHSHAGALAAMHFTSTKKDWFAELKGGTTVATVGYTVNWIMAELISRKHVNSVCVTCRNARREIQVVWTVGLHIRFLMSIKIWFSKKEALLGCADHLGVNFSFFQLYNVAICLKSCQIA